MAETVTVKFRMDDGDVVTLKVKSETLLTKLIKAWETKKGVGQGVYKFTYDGKKVDPLRSVEEHDINDGDFVDVLLEQKGGRLGSF